LRLLAAAGLAADRLDGILERHYVGLGDAIDLIADQRHAFKRRGLCGQAVANDIEHRAEALGSLLGQAVDADLDLLGCIRRGLLESVDYHIAAFDEQLVLLTGRVSHALKTGLPINSLPVAEFSRILDLDEGLGRSKRIAGRLGSRLKLQAGQFFNLGGQVANEGKSAINRCLLVRAPLKDILLRHLFHSSIHSVTGIAC
jgi:hypothetical protein